MNYHVEKYGDVAGIKIVDLTDDVLLISSDGIVIRIPADSIRVCARPSKGVRVMRVTEGNRVVTVVRTAHEEGEASDELPEDDGEPDLTEEELRAEREAEQNEPEEIVPDEE